MTPTNQDDLERIFEEVLNPDPLHHAGPGLLSYQFKDGTRLSFLCGSSGRLNGVIIQRPSTEHVAGTAVMDAIKDPQK